MAPLALPALARLSEGGAEYYIASAARYPADLLGYLLPGSINPLTRPLNLWLTGGERVYSAGPIEGPVGLGWSVIVLAALGWRQSPVTTRVAAVLFLLLSLGVSLSVAGHPVPVPLPGALLDHLPILRGLRVPARFGIMVALMVVPMVAAGAARVGRRWGRMAVGAAILVVFVELAPFGYPTADATVDPAYREMGEDPLPGAVLDLPHLYLRRNMIRHAAHRRPIAGGWVGRVEPPYRREFEQRVAPLFDAPGPEDDPLALFRDLGIRYVLVEPSALAEHSAATAIDARLTAAFPEGPWRRTADRVIYRVEPVSVRTITEPEGAVESEAR